MTNKQNTLFNDIRYTGLPVSFVLSKRDDCTRKRQTCCETGTQSRESLANFPAVKKGNYRQKTVWLPKAIGESGFSVHLVLRIQTRRYDSGELAFLPVHNKLDEPLTLLRKSSPNTRELCLGSKASSLTSPSFLFSGHHSSFRLPNFTRVCGVLPSRVVAVLCGKGTTTWSNAHPTLGVARR